MADKIDSIDTSVRIQNGGNTPSCSDARTVDEKTSFHGGAKVAESRFTFQLTSADLRRSDLTGLSFNAYHMGRRLGQGGMGQVFLATHAKLGKQFAVKFISSEVHHDPQAMARFEHEATALGKLEHPNLVRATDAGLSDGLHFIITEYVDGQNLSQWVEENGPVDLPVACDWVRQAAEGLMHAAQRGVIHRDIKPSNLIIDSQGTIRVIDFGIASLGDQVEGLTVQGQILGTLDFLAPEQAENARNASVRSDIYGLGCTLYFLVTGKAPFAGPGYGTVASKIHAHRYEKPLPVQRFGISTPKGFQALLDRMLAKNAAERFQDYAELLAYLSSYCGAEHSQTMGRGDGWRSTKSSGGLGALESWLAWNRPAPGREVVYASVLIGIIAACLTLLIVGSSHLWIKNPSVVPGIPARSLGQGEIDPEDRFVSQEIPSIAVAVPQVTPATDEDLLTLSVEEEEGEDEEDADEEMDEGTDQDTEPVNDSNSSASPEQDEEEEASYLDAEFLSERPAPATTKSFREAEKSGNHFPYPALGDKKTGSWRNTP